MYKTLKEKIASLEPVEEWLAGLTEVELMESRAHLLETLTRIAFDDADAAEGHLVALAPPQVTQAYLERLFPDEPTVRAYLHAVKFDDGRLLTIESQKSPVTDNLFRPLPAPGREHAELIELVWAAKHQCEESISPSAFASFIVDQFLKWDDERCEAIFKTWSAAEKTRLEMKKLVGKLAAEKIPSKTSIVAGTYMEKPGISLRKWLIAAALVSQFGKNPTPDTLAPVLNISNTITPTRVLTAMRRAMVRAMGKVNIYSGDIAYIDGMLPRRRLYFNVLGDYHDTEYQDRDDLMLPRIGTMKLETANRLGRFADPRPGDAFTVRPASFFERQSILNAFDYWRWPQRAQRNDDFNFLILTEFTFRYLEYKRKLMGWRVVNDLLRALLKPID